MELVQLSNASPTLSLIALAAPPVLSSTTILKVKENA